MKGNTCGGSAVCWLSKKLNIPKLRLAQNFGIAVQRASREYTHLIMKNLLPLVKFDVYGESCSRNGTTQVFFFDGNL